MADDDATKAGRVVSGRLTTGILGKSAATRKKPVGKGPPGARAALPGPIPAGSARKAGQKRSQVLVAVPAWMNGKAKGLDLTTQFRTVKNPTFDWQAVADANEFVIQNRAVVKEKIQFVVLKATLGAGSPTPFFKENWTRLKSMYRNFVRGAYHFLLFGPHEDGARQAQAYLNAVDSFSGTLPPILDVEDVRKETLKFLGFESHKNEKGQEVTVLVDRKAFNHGRAKCVDDIKAWIKIVRAATGRDTIIYTFPFYWPTIGSPQDFKNQPLWIADYSLPASGQPRLPVGGGWNTWTMWQFAGFPQTKTQSVPGLGHGVDLNLFNGNTLDLVKFAYDGKLIFPVMPVSAGG
jgi:GH25 family lysozyme M1 (1,4-beta-N-acetylmuramidase)